MIASNRAPKKEILVKEEKTNEKDDFHEGFVITSQAKIIEYYHGLIPRADVEPLLKKDSDFILRKTDNNGAIILALSVHWEKQVKHFMINQNENKEFYLEAHTEKTVNELVNWHLKTKVSCSVASGAKLVTPIERPSWILTHDSVKMIRKLDEGAFGEVYMADFTSSTGVIQVAVKTMREEVEREARLKFMKEARLMRRLKHKYIVKILGVAVYEHPIMLVIELCLGGSLLNHLRKNKNKVTPNCKLRFCTESAAGLAYLEKQNFIHRDVAARNCLLSDKTEVKISDFGMSDDRKQLTDDKLNKVPVKWLAPETMQNKIYNNKTDVWSFGVLVYKIYSDGNEPYPGLTNVQTRAKIVVQNDRMDLTKETPTAVFKLVAKCWDKDSAERPQFKDIFKMLTELANTSKRARK